MSVVEPSMNRPVSLRCCGRSAAAGGADVSLHAPSGAARISAIPKPSQDFNRIAIGSTAARGVRSRELRQGPGTPKAELLQLRSAQLQNAAMYDWGDLKVFLAVARAGSTLAAARELGVNQTTVARRVA